MNQTTINFLKNKEGKYLNFKDINSIYYTDSFVQATPIPNMKDAIKLASHFNLEIKSVDLELFKKEYSLVVSRILIIGDMFLNELKRWNNEIPILKVNKHTRNAVQNALGKLKDFHKLSDDVAKNGTDELFFEASGDFEEMIRELSFALDNNTMKDVIKKIKGRSKKTA